MLIEKFSVEGRVMVDVITRPTPKLTVAVRNRGPRPRCDTLSIHGITTLSIHRNRTLPIQPANNFQSWNISKDLVRILFIHFGIPLVLVSPLSSSATIMIVLIGQTT